MKTTLIRAHETEFIFRRLDEDAGGCGAGSVIRATARGSGTLEFGTPCRAAVETFEVPAGGGDAVDAGDGFRAVFVCGEVRFGDVLGAYAVREFIGSGG